MFQTFGVSCDSWSIYRVLKDGRLVLIYHKQVSSLIPPDLVARLDITLPSHESASTYCCLLSSERGTEL